MDLVNELQGSVEQDDVLTVLRKTMRVASKLNRQDISDWLRAELNGYPTTQPVPDYRMIRVIYAFYANGVISNGVDRIVSQAIPTGAVDTPLRVGESIATVLTMIADFDKGQGIYLRSVEALDKAISAQDQFDPMFHSQVALRVRLNDREVRAIPDRIKDKVLEWALALERAGIKGKDFSFTEEEKHNARSTTFYLDNCHVEQVSNLGTNLKES